MRTDIFMGKLISTTFLDEVSKREGIFDMLWRELNRKTTMKGLPLDTLNLEYMLLQVASNQLNFLQTGALQAFANHAPDSEEEIDEETEAFLKSLFTQLDEHLDNVMSRFGFEYDH